MTGATDSGGSLRDAIAAEVLSPEPDAALRACVATLAALCGDSLDAVVFFGSRRTGAAKANAWSAYDLYAIVPAYRPFFAALRAAGFLRRRPGWLALLGHWLPPTQISLRFAEPELRAKVSVIQRDRFRRETSARRRDHFTIGRLFQPSRIEYARSGPLETTVLDALVSAYAETWRWARPWLPRSFGSEEYGRALLATSMSWEIRPEPSGRAAALWSAQRSAQLPMLEALLADLERRGELRQGGDARPSWTMVSPPALAERLSLRVYFSVSLLRATARWVKHMLSFEGWLDYIVRKVSRHTGEPIELSPRERRWPLVFLWARLFSYLRHKNGKKVSS